MSIEIQRINRRWPRFVLARQDGGYWTGTHWANAARSARLFASREAASSEYERLRGGEMPAGETREFETTLKVRLTGQGVEQIDVNHLIRFLHRYVELVLPLADPAEGALLQAEVAWHRLRESLPKHE